MAGRTQHAAMGLSLGIILARVAAAGGGESPATTVTALPAPILEEHRYRMSAAIRPLFFWIRARDVGAARIIWRSAGDGRRGYELLIGSDPRRAPRRINRWGWAREDADPSGATMVGVMRKTDEESLSEAASRIAGEAGGGSFLFKAIRARVANGVARAENTVFRLTSDYTYHELDEVLRMAGSAPRSAPRVRQAAVREGTRPGFLSALAELVRQGVGADGPVSGRGPLAGRSLPYTFNAGMYDLRLRAAEWLEAATYGGRRYERLLRMRFDSYNRELRTHERFTLVCGTEGRWAGVPVFIEYQPKWWFKADGVLDETEVFDDDATHPTAAAGGRE